MRRGRWGGSGPHIEEYLGRNTQAYYDVLAEVGHGSWNPGNDTRPWVRFCLTAHFRQARTHIRRVEEAEALWVAMVDLARRHQLPERCAGALSDAALGLRIRNSTYRALVEEASADEISSLTASRDLNALVHAGLLEPVGQKRGRYYVGGSLVMQARAEIKQSRTSGGPDDPFALASDQLQLRIA